MMPTLLAVITYLLYLSLVSGTSNIDNGIDYIHQLFNSKQKHDIVAKSAYVDGEPSAEIKPVSQDTRRRFPILTADWKSHEHTVPQRTIALTDLKRLSDRDNVIRQPRVYLHGTTRRGGAASDGLVNYINEDNTKGKSTKGGEVLNEAITTKRESVNEELRDTDVGLASTRESNTPHHRQKRGFRSAVADRIAHGFGKRTHPSVYNTFTSVADLLARDYITDDARSDRQIGIPIVELAKQFHDDEATLVDYISSYIDVNDDGVIDLKELLGDQ